MSVGIVDFIRDFSAQSVPIVGDLLDLTFDQGWSESQLLLKDSFISSEVQFMYAHEAGSTTSFRFVGTFTIGDFCPPWLDSLRGAVDIIASMGSRGADVGSKLHNLLDDVESLCKGGSITMKFSTNGGEIDLQHTSLTVSGKEITLQDLKEFLGFWDLENGKGCLADAQCVSDRCDKWLTCQPKLKDGEGWCGVDNNCVDGIKCSWALTCGQECAWDSECSTGYCSNRLICEPKEENGSGCVEDDDCVSGRCNKFLKCVPKLKDGEGTCGADNDCVDGAKCSWALTCGKECWQDRECSTGRCSKRLICEPKLRNGGACFEDEDCKSGRCAKSFTCRDKLRKNEYCWKHDDCQSNRCNCYSWGWFVCC